MRTYQVWMKPSPERDKKMVEVKAEDVDLDMAGDGANIALFWNFMSADKDAITVAAFPHEVVDFIVSIPG